MSTRCPCCGQPVAYELTADERAEAIARAEALRRLFEQTRREKGSKR